MVLNIDCDVVGDVLHCKRQLVSFVNNTSDLSCLFDFSEMPCEEKGYQKVS